MQGKVLITQIKTPSGEVIPLNVEIDLKQLALRAQTNVLMAMVDHQNEKTEAKIHGEKRTK